MTGYLKGLVMGSALTVAALTGYAYGTAFSTQHDEADLESMVESGQCRVRVGYARPTGGYKCDFDKIMVGAQEGVIYCADINVSCD